MLLSEEAAMRRLILMLSSVVLGACAGSIGPQPNPLGSPPREPTAAGASPIAPTNAPGLRADLPDLGEAPELNNEVWLNTERPLRLSDLRGKVVLIDMWTFG
jgi:hypothetical protein